MLSEGICSSKRGNIPLEVLEKLRAINVEQVCGPFIRRHGDSPDSIARKFASLNIYSIISQVTEDEHNYPYLKRNVMIEVEIADKEKLTIEEKANRIEDKILRDDEIFDFPPI